MLKDFAKLHTFMVVVKEKSFSKASAKLGISQPAVTQQIKFIEEYLDTKIVERKKNGIKLTKEGEDLHKIAQRLEKAITSSERDLLKIINKEFTFVIGASNAIGNYVLPQHIPKLKDAIQNDIYVKVENSELIISLLEDKQIDLALIESPIFRDNIIYREWVEDELVIFSNKQLPRSLTAKDLKSFQWYCRDEQSHTKKLMSEAFDEIGVDCRSFDVLGVLSGTTAVKEAVIRADQNSEKQVVSVISTHAISEDVKNGTLFCAPLKNKTVKRKFYIAYSKDRKHDAFIENVVNFLFQLKV
ncbi:MAG: LysR family transcriptional regulator [Helicobacteraceae bacterium]|nr:LysR family transcriptional regulator [Helicobacteraceae bacterium]